MCVTAKAVQICYSDCVCMKEIKKQIAIKLFPQEHIRAAQRKHWLALVFSLATHVVVILAMVGILLFFVHQQYPFIFLAVTFSISLILLSFLGVYGTFTVMDWYFDFYIITNKRLIHEHFFKLSGSYYEEVFLTENIHSVELVEKNLFYDFFDVDDVYIHFPTYDREEPFIFSAPANASEIERLIEESSLPGKKEEGIA